LASLLLGSAVVAAAQAGQFGGKIQIAECWHFCIFIDFNLAAADELLRSDFRLALWPCTRARAGHDSVVGIQAAKNASIALNAGFSELGVVHNEVFSHGQLVEVRWTASEFTPGVAGLSSHRVQDHLYRQ